MERGVELCLFGGNANNGAQSGLAYVNSNNAFSHAHANYGARLTYKSQQSGSLKGNHGRTSLSNLGYMPENICRNVPDDLQGTSDVSNRNPKTSGGEKKQQKDDSTRMD
nr:hypothetical protein [uncultured Prevotella sp.]